MNIRKASASIFWLSVVLLCTSPGAVAASPWVVEQNGDGTCAMGGIFDFGSRDTVVVAVTSFGLVSIISDKASTGRIEVDGATTIRPIRTLSAGHHVYADRLQNPNAKVLFSAFKSGYTAKLFFSDGSSRALNLRGFTNAYNRYRKCARN